MRVFYIFASHIEMLINKQKLTAHHTNLRTCHRCACWVRKVPTRNIQSTPRRRGKPHPRTANLCLYMRLGAAELLV